MRIFAFFSTYPTMEYEVEATSDGRDMSAAAMAQHLKDAIQDLQHESVRVGSLTYSLKLTNGSFVVIPDTAVRNLCFKVVP